MTSKMRAIGVLAATVLVAGGTLGEEDGLIVTPLSSTDFEVVAGAQMLPITYWCGAATYVERRKGWDASTRIFIRTPVGPSVTRQGAKAVGFTIDPSGIPSVPDAYGISISQAGASMKSFQARRNCREAFTRSTK